MPHFSKALVAVMALTASAFAADKPLGKPLTLKQAMPLATLMASPDKFAGQTVQVTGKVTEVCEMAGCWMNLTDIKGNLLRIKVDDGDIVFPKTAVGKPAIAEGKLEKLERTREQLIEEGKEEAREQHRKFDASKIKSGKTIYQIAGTGAVITE
jgi:hypothetical protein